MAVLTRTPLLFTGLFFVIEAAAPTRGKRMDELKALAQAWQPFARKVGL